MMKVLFNKFILACLVVIITAGACKKNLEIRPDTSNGSLLPEDAIKSVEDMQQLLLSCYDACANMMNGQMQVTGDLLADDVSAPTNNDGFLTGIYNRNTSMFNSWVGGAYAQPYFTIYRVNVMDLYYDKITASDEVKNRMKGEAAFLRALCHFEAAKLWGQPPGYTPDNSHLGVIERVRARNEALQRSTVASNYNLIISDLIKAIDLLPTNNGVYANKNAAKALLARVYFLMNNNDAALPLLNDIIAAGYSISDSLNRFKRDETASEHIFGFVTTGIIYDIANRGGTYKGMYRYDLIPAPALPVLGVSKELGQQLANDLTDKRAAFIELRNAGLPNETYLTNKFNMNDFASPYLHITEMLLTRAEINAINGNAAAAIADLLPIIRRAYGNASAKEVAINSMTAPQLVEEIRIQRRLEMFLEGDRLAQVKRIGAIKGRNNLLVRGKPWDCDGMVLQFPASAGTVRGFVFNPTAICN